MLFFFRITNPAQECLHVGFDPFDGTSEGGAVETGGRCVGGEQHHERAHSTRYLIALVSRGRVGLR